MAENKAKTGTTPKEKAYHEDVDTKNIKRLRELQKELPDFTKSYFLSIELRMASRTRVAYAYDLILFFRYLQNETHILEGQNYYRMDVTILDEVKAMDIESYLSYLQTYSTSIDGESEIERRNHSEGQKRKLSSLRSFYNYYFRMGKIKTNPAEMVQLPKLKKKPIVRMEANEVADLLDHVESGEQLSKRQLMYHDKTEVRDIAMISLLLGTGMRVSECVGLNVDDIDLAETSAKIFRKGGKEAVVYFSDEVSENLAPYLEQRANMKPAEGHENALFLSLQNRRISVRAVENLVKKYTRTVTTMKNITPHKLRSTFGTALYQETGDIYLVASVLGHSDVNTTKTHYADMEEDQKRMARNSVKLRKD